MRELTNTIVLNCFRRKQELKTKVINWRNNLLARSVAWVLHLPQVRDVVVGEVQSVFIEAIADLQNPICKAIDETIDDALNHFDPEISAEDVKGLEQEIERCFDHAMDNVDFDAKEIRELSRIVTEAVEEAIECKEVIDQLTKEVTNAIADQLRNH